MAPLELCPLGYGGWRERAGEGARAWESGRTVSQLRLGVGEAESKVEVAAMENWNSCMVATFRTLVTH
jgi:hypothetical protein